MTAKSPLKQLLDVYEKLYFFELDRKEKLLTRMPILLALFSILLGALASFIPDIPGNGALGWRLVFYLMAAGQVVCIVCAGHFTFQFLNTDDYDYLVPKESNDSLISASDDLEPLLLEKYQNMVAHNFQLNKDKSANFFTAFRFLTIGAILGSIGACAYFALKVDAGKAIHAVAITNIPKVIIMSDTTSSPEKETPKDASSRQQDNDATDNKPAPEDGTGLGVYRLRDRYTTAESKRRGEWVPRK